MTTFGFLINTKTAAISQYMGLNFDSMCLFEGKIFGAGPTGIMEMTGDDDSGTDIEAYFQLASTDLGIPDIKKLRSLIISGYQHGNLTVQVVCDNEELTEYTVNLPETGIEGTTQIDLNSDDIGRYVSLLIKNIAGSDFSIDALDLLVIPTKLVLPAVGIFAKAKAVHPIFTGVASAS